MSNKLRPNAGFATRAIHYGYDPKSAAGALVPPVHMTSTYVFDDVAQGAARFEGTDAGYFYSRINNPTVDLLERRIASLEGAQAGLAFASGMGAITATLWTLLQAGDELLTDETLYGCTFAFLRSGLSKFGVRIRHVDMRDPQQVAAAINAQTRVIYFETPANPNMRIIDIEAICKIAKARGVTSVVDNTYASPYLTRPIELGADIVLHSATKYLGGHGDLVAGVAAGSQELMQRIRLEGLKDMTGAVIAPLTAHQIMRGMKTLALRMDRHCQSAQVIAEYLAQHPAISEVYYPGLKSFAQHELAKRQMAQFGGMIAFELRGGREAGIQLMNALSLIQRAVSLGDADSLIQHPASMTHSVYSEDERRKHHISEGLVRLSVGLEEVQDLLVDLEQALALCHKLHAA